MKLKGSRKKKKKSFFLSGGPVIRVTITGIIMACIIVAFYYQLSHRLSSNEERGVKVDELEICLTQDFISNYPESPKKVVEWYNRIITLFYSENLKNHEIEDLCDQLILLMDKELSAKNPRDTYVATVKQDIEMYKQRNKKIVSTEVAANDQIKYVTAKNGDDLAYVISYYFTQEASSYVSSYQTYCLKRDGAGKYKILSFALTDDKGVPLGGGE